MTAKSCDPTHSLRRVHGLGIDWRSSDMGALLPAAAADHGYLPVTAAAYPPTEPTYTPGGGHGRDDGTGLAAPGHRPQPLPGMRRLRQGLSRAAATRGVGAHWRQGRA